MERWEILASIVALMWAFFKTTTWYEMRRNSNITRIYEALEIGVQIAWEKVVKPWLEKNGKDQALPAHVRLEAEHAAIEAAAKADQIIKRAPSETIRATLKMAVEEAKRRGGK